MMGSIHKITKLASAVSQMMKKTGGLEGIGGIAGSIRGDFEGLGGAIGGALGGKTGSGLTGVFTNEDVNTFFSELSKIIKLKVEPFIPEDPTGKQKRDATATILKAYQDAWDAYRRKYNIKLKK